MTIYDNPPTLNTNSQAFNDGIKLNHEYITFETKEAIEGLGGLVQKTKQGKLNDGDMLVDIWHALGHLNRAYNLRQTQGRWPKNDFEKSSRMPKDLINMFRETKQKPII